VGTDLELPHLVCSLYRRGVCVHVTLWHVLRAHGHHAGLLFPRVFFLGRFVSLIWHSASTGASDAEFACWCWNAQEILHWMQVIETGKFVSNSVLKCTAFGFILTQLWI